jgi:hypothetical protein
MRISDNKSITQYTRPLEMPMTCLDEDLHQHPVQIT